MQKSGLTEGYLQVDTQARCHDTAVSESFKSSEYSSPSSPVVHQECWSVLISLAQKKTVLKQIHENKAVHRLCDPFYHTFEQLTIPIFQVFSILIA